MAKPKPKPPDDQEQSRRFLEAAKELEADKTGSAFHAILTAPVLSGKRPPSGKPPAARKGKK
jgi:hypothetical protein